MMRTGALVRLTRQSEAFWVGRLTTQNASANRGRMVSTTWPMVWRLGEENMRRKMSKAIQNFELRNF